MATASTTTAPVKIGESTPRQVKRGQVGVAGVKFKPGFGAFARRGTIDTYRKMRNHPTIALARAIFNGPILGAEWSVEGEEGEIRDFITDQVTRHHRSIIREMVRALDYGYQAFEMVWAIQDGKTVLERAKPLLPELTDALVDEHTGKLLGARNGKDRAGNELRLDLSKVLWFTYDGEAEDPYGRSRFENIREHAYEPWVRTATKLDQYNTIAAGVIPMVKYEPGVSYDASGAEVDNFDIASRILSSLSRGDGIAFPTQAASWVRDIADVAMKLDQITKFRIEFMDKGGQHGAEFVSDLQYKDRLMFRGLLLPERAGVEGVSGARAEADKHGDTAIMNGEEVSQAIAGCVNRAIVDRLVAANYGPSAVGSVWVKPAPLVDEDRAFLQEVMRAAMADPLDSAGVVARLSVDALAERLGIPLEVVDEAGVETVLRMANEMTRRYAAMRAGNVG